jgi:hypothetical protein
VRVEAVANSNCFRRGCGARIRARQRHQLDGPIRGLWIAEAFTTGVHFTLQESVPQPFSIILQHG